MGVDSVPVPVTLSHADTIEVYCHSLITELLSALESMKSKIPISYRCYSSNVYMQNHLSTALKQLGKTIQTQIILPPETTSFMLER